MLRISAFIVFCAAVNASFAQLQYDVEESSEFLTICVELSGEFETMLSVEVSASSMNMVADSDFVFSSLTLSFAPMQTNQCFNVSIVNDQLVEAREEFVINMVSLSRAVNVVTNSTTVIINDSSVVNFTFDREVYFTIEGTNVLICVLSIGELDRLVEVTVNLDTRGEAEFPLSV